MEQKNEARPHLYGQVAYNKESKNIQWETNSIFNKWCWEICQKNKTGPLSYTIHKNKLKMD